MGMPIPPAPRDQPDGETTLPLRQDKLCSKMHTKCVHCDGKKKDFYIIYFAIISSHDKKWFLNKVL